MSDGGGSTPRPGRFTPEKETLFATKPRCKKKKNKQTNNELTFNFERVHPIV
jgi:hypothetical protein